MKDTFVPALRSVSAIPPLDAMLADPSLFDSLPHQAQDAVYGQIVVAEAEFRAKLLTRRDRVDERASAGSDRAVRLREAVTLLGMTKDFLYRHWETLGGYRDLDGHIKFSLSTIQRHIQGKVRR